MRNVLMLTDVDFWKLGAGHRMRISGMAKYLSIHINLTIVYIGKFLDTKEAHIESEFNCRLIVIKESIQLSTREYGNQLKAVFEQIEFEVCIIQYIHNSIYLPYIPEGIKTIIDTHDLIYQRSDSFKKSAYANPTYEMSQETELGIYNMYDYIIVICEPDMNELSQHFDSERLLLCPHPTLTTEHTINRFVTEIAFVGSEYLPNQDAVMFFLNECWPEISKKHEVSFNVYGRVANNIQLNSDSKNVFLRGYVENINQVYRKTDIAINPVRYGAGLKIKNVEALGFGIPLITTSHGARGFENENSNAFLIANTPSEIIQCVNELIENYKLRMELSINAKKFISEWFKPEKCFNSLLNIINC